MSKIELLAPAGSIQSVFPAVRMGADAVYIGAQKFGARSNAGNFNKEELKEAIEYCHVRDKKVYLTANTLVRDDEISEALNIIEYASSLPIDAVIVQDVGLASLIKSCAPNLKIHGSTQMSIHTPQGALALYDAGFSRIVLSRELSKEEIKEISRSCDIELEVFVHGALCMSVSGQCYFSSILGGRSGNRGLCAQPCRLPFMAKGGTGHDLSLKDLSIIEYLNELEEIGVKSAKIEGRMKRPEYVAAAVLACRNSIDGKFNCDDIKVLESIFARSGFTDGYYKGERGKGMFGVRSKEDVVAATNEVFSKLRVMYKDEKPIIPIDFELKIKEDNPITLCAVDNHKNSVKIKIESPAKALRAAIDHEKCKSQLKKTGGTPFYCNSLKSDIDEGLSISTSSLNTLRRKALEEIENKRKYRKPIEFSTVSLPNVNNHKALAPIKIRARFPSTNVPLCFKGCEVVYVPLNSKLDDIKKLIDNGLNIAVEIPRGLFGREEKALELLKRAKEAGVKDAWASNIGSITLAQKANMNVHGGFGLNITNTASVEWAEDSGLCDIETSFELTLDQIAKLGGKIKRGIIAYGRLPLMLTRNCPISNGESNCANCKSTSFIKDRKNIDFKVMCNYGCSEVLNCVPIYMADRINEIRGVDFIVLRFTVENSVESEERLRHFYNKSRFLGEFTRGLYYRGVE